MMICGRYAHIRLRFFSRQMLELGETTLQLFRGILPAILKTNENQRLINDINQSIAQSILRTFCTYLSINRSIDRAILNLRSYISLSYSVSLQSDDFYSFNHHVPLWGFKAFYSYIIKFTSKYAKKLRSCQW